MNFPHFSRWKIFMLTFWHQIITIWGKIKIKKHTHKMLLLYKYVLRRYVYREQKSLHFKANEKLCYIHCCCSWHTATTTIFVFTTISVQRTKAKRLCFLINIVYTQFSMLLFLTLTMSLGEKTKFLFFSK